MSIFEEVSENIVDLTKLGITTGLGYGVYKSGELFNLTKQQKQVTNLLSLGVIGYGTYNYLKRIAPLELPPELSVEKAFPVFVSKPYDGEDLSVLLPHYINVRVSNPYDREYTVYVGYSLYTPKGNIYDGDVIRLTIPAKDSRTINKILAFPFEELGMWKIRFSAWNKYPTETTEDLVRIGDSGWINFELSWV